MNSLKPFAGRLVFTALGLATAVLFMTLGFWRTILILLCCGAGYAVGTYKDKGLPMPEWLWFWRNRW